MLLHGGTAGADADWLRGLLGAMVRGAAFTGLAAVVGASLALLGRNTAVALGATFVYLNFVESAVRGGGRASGVGSSSTMPRSSSWDRRRTSSCHRSLR